RCSACTDRSPPSARVPVRALRVLPVPPAPRVLPALPAESDQGCSSSAGSKVDCCRRYRHHLRRRTQRAGEKPRAVQKVVSSNSSLVRAKQITAEFRAPVGGGRGEYEKPSVRQERRG